MKTFFAIIICGLMSLACSQEPDLSTPEGIANEAVSLVDEIADLCNGDLNQLTGVSCIMSISDWTMELTFPSGDPFRFEIEQIADLFCRVSEVTGVEPKITVNGLPKVCGGVPI